MADQSSNCDGGETDIYDDLPNFQFDEAFKKLEQDKAYLQNKVEVLAAQLEEMKKENEKLAAKIKALGKNISCLYKTAQRELERKEEIIADLRRERDDLLFRRGLQDYKPGHSKRPSRKQLTPTKKVRNGGLRKILEGKGKSDATNDGTITPTSQEYEQISSLASDSSKKSATVVNTVVNLDPEVVDLSDSEPNVECQKDVNSSVKVKRTNSSVNVKGTEPSAVSSIVPASVGVPKENKFCCEEIVGGQKSKESLDDTPNQSSRVALEVEEKSTRTSNSGTEVQAETDEPRVPTSTTTTTTNGSTGNSNLTPERVSEDEKSSSFTNNNNKNVEVTSPVKDKISVHMSSEDCGFGRRRVRRVVKPSLSPATAVNTTSAERGVKRTLEETSEAAQEILQQPQLLAVEISRSDPRVQKRRCVDGVLTTGNKQNQLGDSEDDGGAESEKCKMGNQTGSSCRSNADDLIVLRYDDTEEKEKNQVETICEPKSCDRTVQDVKRTDKYQCSSANEKGNYDDERGRMNRNTAKNSGSSYGVCALEGKTNRPVQASELISPGEPDGEGMVRKVKGSRVISSNERDLSGKGENVYVDNGHLGESPQLSPNLSYASDNRSPRRLSPCSRMTDDEPSSRRSWDRERVSGPSSSRNGRPHGEGARCGYTKSGNSEGKGDFEGQRGREHWEPSDKGRETVRQGSGREDLPSDKNADHDRGSHRGRNGSREMNRDYGWGRSRERSKDRDYDRSRDYNQDRSWDQSRDRSRERSLDRSGERSRDRSRERSHDRHRGRSGDRGRGRSRDRSWDRGQRRSRERSRERDRGRSGDRSRGRSRDRSHERERRYRDHDGGRDRIRDERDRGYDRYRDKERSREYDRRRGSERGRNFNRGRGSFRGRNRNRGAGLDRSGDFDRGRESQGSKDSDRSRDGGKGRDCRNVNSCRSLSSEESPGRTEGKGSCQSKPDEKPNDGNYDLRNKLDESNLHPDMKGSVRSRDGVRGRYNRNIRRQNVEDSPGEGEEKVTCQNKPYEKPADGRYHLRNKLGETEFTPVTSKGVGKKWNGGYEDLDNPSNDDIEVNTSSGPKRVKDQESNTIRSPDNQVNSDARELIPYISEWD